jgi:hypothetical protein
MSEEQGIRQPSREPHSQLAGKDPEEETALLERLGHIMFDGNRQNSDLSAPLTGDSSSVGSTVQWQLTTRSLVALRKSDAWRNSGIEERLGFSPTDVYGPHGKISFAWGQAWDSASGMRAALCSNMGGGVPIQVIDELVRLSRID